MRAVSYTILFVAGLIGVIPQSMLAQKTIYGLQPNSASTDRTAIAKVGEAEANALKGK
jgi:hypothetical protein